MALLERRLIATRRDLGCDLLELVALPFGRALVTFCQIGAVTEETSGAAAPGYSVTTHCVKTGLFTPL